MARLDYDALNATVRAKMISVFSVEPGVLGGDRDAIAAEAAEFFRGLEERGVVTRGIYNLTGMRADADFMFFIHAETVEQLQAAYADFRRTTALGRAADPTWSCVGLHRPAEFNRSRIPAFIVGEEPQRYLCVYPYVRSYEWYLLPEEDRRRMLAEHGRKARDYPNVRPNTTFTFGLSDYEWLLAFEGPELTEILDLMRHLRNTEARRHTREEIPFFTGPRIGIDELVASLP